MRSGGAALAAGAARGLAGTVPPPSRARPTLGHRADIDGLRAVAVVPVLLYHAGLPAFGGGFVGVDVFFVISGYLITSIVLGDLEAGRFSLLAFYERRVRRILPALFAVILASLALGPLVLLPDDLKDLGQSAAAAALSASNLLFWYASDYFDVVADREPLLHTWSLAVEEQFYLVFPVALLLLLRTFRHRAPHALAVLALLSFALAAWGVREAPSAAFYLAPFRAWELLLGALLATGVVPAPGRQGVRDGLSLLGLGLIAWPVLTLSSATPFPGAAALAPCLGAALVIHAGVGGRSLAGRILGAGPLAFLGLISYSLYLWHWPLLVFARSWAARELTTAEALAVLLLAGAVAVASWRWIERPFRAGRTPVLGRRRLFAAAGVATAATAALGLGLHLARGLPGRLPPDAARLAEGAGDRNPDRGQCLDPSPDLVRAGRLCPIGAGRPARAATFVVWGDSHAETLRAALDEVATRAGRSGSFAGRAGCPPLPGVTVGDSGGADAQGCIAFNEAVLDRVLRDDAVETVVLAARWSLYATGLRHGRESEGGVPLGDDLTEPRSPGSDELGANEAVLRRGLERAAAVLAWAGKEVVVVGPIPSVGVPVPWTLALAAWRGRDVDIRPERAAFEARDRAVLSVLGGLSRRDLARVVYPHAALCDDARCRVEDDGRTLYTDDHHLSRRGADALVAVLEEVLRPRPAARDQGRAPPADPPSPGRPTGRPPAVAPRGVGAEPAARPGDSSTPTPQAR